MPTAATTSVATTSAANAAQRGRFTLTAALAAPLAALWLCTGAAEARNPAPPVGAGATSAASVQGGSKLSEELRYARGLATRFQFLDLAEAVIASVEGQRLDAEEQEQLALARAQIFGEAGRFQNDPERRRALFNQSLEAYESFLAAHPLSPNRPEAERAYVEVGATYGLLAEQELEELSGERADRLRNEAVDRLTAIAGYTGDAIGRYPEPGDLDEAQRRNLAQLQLSRGQLLLQLGRLSGESGDFYLTSALTTLENLIYLMGDDSGWGMNAYILMAEVHLAQDDPETALTFAEYVIDRAIPRSRDEWNALIAEYQLTQADKDVRWSFLEVALPLALRCAVRLEQEDTRTQFALHFYNTWMREGFTISPRGYLAQLDVARALLERGGVLGGSPSAGTLEWYESSEAAQAAGHNARNIRSAADQALSLARTVGNDNPRSFLQTQAQKVVAEAISMPGVSVSPETLFQAAEGELNSGNFDAAVDAFKRVLASADSTSQLVWGGKVYYNIGLARARQGRMLEAAMAFEEGARRYRSDEEAAANNAKEFYRAMQAVRRKAPGDKTIEALWLEAETIAADTGSSDTGDILFRQGDRALAEGDFATARARFLEVPPDSRLREPAMVKAAVALYGSGELDRARDELVQYLEVFVEDPLNRLGPQDGARIERRAVARADAAYHLGLIAADQKRWEDALKRLRNFGADFPGQTDLTAAALDISATAELELGNLDAARGFLERLEQDHKGHPRTGNVATRLYKAVLDLHEAAKAKGDTERAFLLKRQMVQLLAVSNRVYDPPTYGALRDEGLFWLEGGEPVNAEAALKRCLSLYGDDERYAVAIRTNVLPALGRAHLAQREAQEAYDVLADLVPKATDKEATPPAIETAQTYVRSIAGWIEGDGAETVIVPGIGGLERLEEARQWQAKISASVANSAGKWTCAWFEAEVDAIWILVQMGQVDSARMQAASKALTSLSAQAGQDFNMVRERCDGDARVQRLLLWLRTQAR
ncbi:MAG: hypothetical protein GC161_17055 [Planctomycetaceae bacterium]|nr:hypothetical protein [Planctomycetaceae bacterium]